ncbi:MAG: hypothetical protein ACJ74U_20240 [Jatrophihabitantaceae bacterium]
MVRALALDHPDSRPGGASHANGRPRETPCADADIEAIGNANRLCHFLTALTDHEQHQTVSVTISSKCQDQRSVDMLGSESEGLVRNEAR